MIDIPARQSPIETHILLGHDFMGKDKEIWGMSTRWHVVGQCKDFKENHRFSATQKG